MNILSVTVEAETVGFVEESQTAFDTIDVGLVGYEDIEPELRVLPEPPVDPHANDRPSGDPGSQKLHPGEWSTLGLYVVYPYETVDDEEAFRDALTGALNHTGYNGTFDHGLGYSLDRHAEWNYYLTAFGFALGASDIDGYAVRLTGDQQPYHLHENEDELDSTVGSGLELVTSYGDGAPIGTDTWGGPHDGFENELRVQAEAAGLSSSVVVEKEDGDPLGLTDEELWDSATYTAPSSTPYQAYAEIDHGGTVYSDRNEDDEGFILNKLTSFMDWDVFTKNETVTVTVEEGHTLNTTIYGNENAAETYADGDPLPCDSDIGECADEDVDYVHRQPFSPADFWDRAEEERMGSTEGYSTSIDMSGPYSWQNDAEIDIRRSGNQFGYESINIDITMTVDNGTTYSPNIKLSHDDAFEDFYALDPSLWTFEVEEDDTGPGDPE